MTPSFYFWTTSSSSWILYLHIYCNSSIISAAHVLYRLILLVGDWIFSTSTALPILLYFPSYLALTFNTSWKPVKDYYIYPYNLWKFIILYSHLPGIFNSTEWCNLLLYWFMSETPAAYLCQGIRRKSMQTVYCYWWGTCNHKSPTNKEMVITLPLLMYLTLKNCRGCPHP